MLHVPASYLKQFLPVETSVFFFFYTATVPLYYVCTLFREKAIGQGGAEFCLFYL